MAVQQRRVTRTSKDSCDRFLKLTGHLGVDEGPQPSIEQRLTRALESAGDHRSAARERFDEDDTESLLARWHDEGIRASESLRQLLVGDGTDEVDSIRDVELFGELREAWKVVPGAADHITQPGKAGSERRELRDHQVDAFRAFTIIETGNGENDRMTWLVRDTNSAKGLTVHRDGHDLEAFSIHTPLGHPIGGVTTDGQHLVQTGPGPAWSKRRGPRGGALPRGRAARGEDAAV